MGLSDFTGELAALSAAGLWAVATWLFGRLGKRLSPLVLNLAKGGIAIALLLLTLLIRQSPAQSMSLNATVWLILSGGIGIGLGDTAFFATVNVLGARRALLMELLAPPLAAFIALISLKEQLSTMAWMGMGLTFSGVAWVISERMPSAPLPSSSAAVKPGLYLGLSLSVKQGVFWGILAALGQAVGAVLSRAALTHSAVDPLTSTFIRLSAGMGVTLCLALHQGDFEAAIQPLRSQRIWREVAIAAFLGTYLGIWLQQIALNYTVTGIAQALMATSPIFILPLAYRLGEKISPRAIVGAMIALGGIVLLFLNGRR